MALQGVLKRFKLRYRPEAPFPSHREFAHPGAHPTTLFCPHSVLFSLLEPGSVASHMIGHKWVAPLDTLGSVVMEVSAGNSWSVGMPRPAPPCSRQCIWVPLVESETPPGIWGTMGAGLTTLGANVVKDMVNDHALGEPCGRGRDLDMDVS